MHCLLYQYVSYEWSGKADSDEKFIDVSIFVNAWEKIKVSGWVEAFSTKFLSSTTIR